MLKRLSLQIVLDIVIVAVVGIAILILAYVTGFPKFSIADEFSYAVVARNIVEFKGPYTNFYMPPVLTLDGYPAGDVHMPGYIFVLAGSFFIFGPREFAAFLPGQIAFVLGGLVTFWVGRMVFNRQVGFWAALWFFVLPANFVWANVVVAESILALLSVIFLAVWYRSVTTPSLHHSFWLAALIILGAICRETFFIFLLPALYTLWCWPRPTRSKAWLSFLAVFILGFLSVFLPLDSIRASYPSRSFIDGVDWQNILDALDVLQRVIQKNLEAEFKPDTKPLYLMRLDKYFITILVLISFWVLERKFWKLSLYYLVTFLSTFFILFILYDLFRWFDGLRMFTMLMPAGIIAACGTSFYLFSKLRYANLWRYTGLTLGAVLLLIVSILANGQVTEKQHNKFEGQTLITQAIVKQTSGLSQPDAVLAKEAFMYGWQNYPVTVIWRIPSNLGDLQAIREQVVVDMIAVEGASERDQILYAIERGLITDDFKLLSQEAVNDYYIFMRK